MAPMTPLATPMLMGTANSMMLYWRQVMALGSIALEVFSCTHPFIPSTRLDRRKISFCFRS